MIKVVVCDGDGTLQLTSPSTEMRNLVDFLQSSSIQLAVASNNQKNIIERNFHRAGLRLPALIVTPAQIGVKKPSPEFVYRIRDLANVELKEMVYLGDDDKTDMFCAINAGILPIAAKYSNPQIQYGLPITSPKEFQHYLETFGKQPPPYFGWIFLAPCSDTKLNIDIRVLLGNHEGLTPILRAILKDQRDIKIARNSSVHISYLLFHYFVSQCYLSRLIEDIDWITVYPGHTKGSLNPILQAFSRYIAQMFRDRFMPDLIVRHQNAPKSQYQGLNRNIFDQFRTIQLNEQYKEKIIDKVILVLDDFTTYGYSLETARRMLLQANAKHVVCLSMAKYRSEYASTRITGSWNPFSPCTLKARDIRVLNRSGTFNNTADEYFKNNICEYYRNL